MRNLKRWKLQVLCAEITFRSLFVVYNAIKNRRRNVFLTLFMMKSARRRWEKLFSAAWKECFTCETELGFSALNHLFRRERGAARYEKLFPETVRGNFLETFFRLSEFLFCLFIKASQDVSKIFINFYSNFFLFYRIECQEGDNSLRDSCFHKAGQQLDKR